MKDVPDSPKIGDNRDHKHKTDQDQGLDGQTSHSLPPEFEEQGQTKNTKQTRDPLGDTHGSEVASKIAPEQFDDKSKDGIEHQEQGKQLSRVLQPVPDQQEDDEDEHSSQRMVYLGGVEWNMQWSKGLRSSEGDAPGQVALFSITAPGHETADSPNGLSGGQTRGKGIEPAGKRFVLFPEIEPGNAPASQGAAHKDQAPFPELDDLQGMIQKIGRIQENIENPGTQQGAQDKIEAQIRDEFVIELPVPGLLHGQTQAQQNGGGDKEAVAVEGDRADLNQYGMHALPVYKR